jgi:hypothetical protein
LSFIFKVKNSNWKRPGVVYLYNYQNKHPCPSYPGSNNPLQGNNNWNEVQRPAHTGHQNWYADLNGNPCPPYSHHKDPGFDNDKRPDWSHNNKPSLIISGYPDVIINNKHPHKDHYKDREIDLVHDRDHGKDHNKDLNKY